MTTKEKKQNLKRIEYHLRNYYSYQAGRDNLNKQLEFIMPSMTASYEFHGDTGTFNIKSTTEDYAIDRIESKKALVIHEEIERYNIIIQSIDEAYTTLCDLEKWFIDIRYFQQKTIAETAKNIRRSEKTVHRIRNDALDKLNIALMGLVQF